MSMTASSSAVMWSTPRGASQFTKNAPMKPVQATLAETYVVRKPLLSLQNPHSSLFPCKWPLEQQCVVDVVCDYGSGNRNKQPLSWHGGRGEGHLIRRFPSCLFVHPFASFSPFLFPIFSSLKLAVIDVAHSLAAFAVRQNTSSGGPAGFSFTLASTPTLLQV